MQIKNIIDQVRYFQIYINAFLFTDGKFNKKPIYQQVKYFHKFDEEYLLLDNNQKIINQNNFPNIPNNYFFKLYSSSSSYFILVDESSLNLETFLNTSEAIYSIEEKKIIFQNGIIGNRIFEDYAIDGIGQNSIQIFCISKKLKLSSLPLSTLGTWQDGIIEKPYQVAEFCGIYDNTLVCTMTNGAILLLDIEKGEVKSFFNETKVRGGIFQKEESSPLFLGLKHYTFIEINAESGELLKQIDIQNELKRVADIPSESPCWLGVGTSIYQDGLFYFFGDTNFLGIFDPISEKIIDHHWFGFDKKQHQQLKGGVENLQVKDGKIYCLDTLGNLFELER